MDKTVNNNNIANPTIDDLNAEKPAENTDNSTKNINMESIRCDNNSAVFQQNEQKSDFDIVDFVISHSDSRSVRQKSKLPKILLCVILGVMIIDDGCIRIDCLDLTVDTLHHGFQLAVFPMEDLDELLGTNIVGKRPQTLAGAAGQ